MILFLDESNIPRTDKIEPSSPYFIIGGVIVSKANLQFVSSEISSFAAAEFSNLLNLPNFSLHASDMFNVRRDFSGLDKMMLTRKFDMFIDLINKLPITIVVTAIHKQKLLDKYKEDAQDPYNIAFLYSCERFEWHLEDHNIPKGEVVLATRGPGLDKKYKISLDKFLFMGTKNKSLSRVSKPVFQKVDIYSPLQIADFACYSVHKLLNKNEPQLFNRLKPKFRSKNGKIEGFGLIIYPK